MKSKSRTTTTSTRGDLKEWLHLSQFEVCSENEKIS